MSMRRVRIYKGNDSDSNIIGFSGSASNAPDKPQFAHFMMRRGYQWEDTKERPEQSFSIRHIEVRTPLSEEHVKQLGTLCVGGFLDGERIEGIVDPYHDGTLVLDNRKILPDRPLGDGEVISIG
jgi:hypothetical protein